MTISVLITVRSNSSRLPKKCFLPFGDYSVLEHIIRRAYHYDLDPIVCTTREGEDDKIAALSSANGTKIFRGANKNKLLRWSQCCKHFGIESFHTIDADDPFFCGDEIRRSYNMLKKDSLDMVTPSSSSASGGATVGFSLTAEVVSRVSKGMKEDLDTEMMWSFIERLPDLRKAILSNPDDDIITARMTLDYYEDYILLEAVRLIVGNFASRKEIFLLLLRNPELVKINAFRTNEWKENQNIKLSKITNDIN